MRRLALTIAFTILLAGCAASSGSSSTTSTPLTTTSQVAAGLDAVVAALGQAGADVRRAEHVSGTPFSVDAQLVNVDAIKIRVYEYSDVETRAAEEATITMGGWSVNHTPVEWIDDPHYWSQGRVIVLYLGSDPAALDLLTRALGTELDTG